MELIFLALIVLASFLDASGRRKKRQQRMEEMEAEEAREEGAVGTLEGPGPRAGRSPPLPESESPGSSAGADRAPSRERHTADSMIPDELWTILTGQPPPERRPAPAPEPEPEPEPARSSTVEQNPTYEAWGGEEIDDLHRPEAEPLATPSSRTDTPAPITTGPIAAGSLTGSTSGRLPRGRAGSPPDTAPSGRAAGYAALLRSGGRESLRTAVVLKEILDAPPGLRPPGEITAAGGKR